MGIVLITLFQNGYIVIASCFTTGTVVITENY